MEGTRATLNINLISRRMLSTYGKPVAHSLLPQSFPPILRQQLLARQHKGNKLRIERLLRQLDFKRHGVVCQNKSEIIKCLYPTKFAKVRLNDGKSYGNKELEGLGRDLLLLTMNESFLNLFKKSAQDISGFDFNFAAKMDYMSSWKKNPLSLIRRFLKWNNITNLARLPMPDSRLPPRIQCKFDQKAFEAVIGYVSVTNRPDTVSSFLKKRVAKQIAQNIMLR